MANNAGGQLSNPEDTNRLYKKNYNIGPNHFVDDLNINFLPFCFMFHRIAVTTKFLTLSSCIHARCFLKQRTWWNKTVYSTIYCTCDKNINTERKLKMYQQIQKQRQWIQKVQTLTRRTCTEASRAKFSVSGRLVNQGLPAVKISCPWQQYCIAYNPQGEEKWVFRALHESVLTYSNCCIYVLTCIYIFTFLHLRMRIDLCHLYLNENTIKEYLMNS